MGHVKLKPTREIKMKFNPNELDNVSIPQENRQSVSEYIRSKRLADEDNNDLFLMFEDSIVYGFDYLHGKSKRAIIEISPTTIFYSNAVMSSGMLEHYKNILLSQSKDILRWDEKTEPINLTHVGMYFQLAINCIINLQAALESFANKIIPAAYPYLDKDGKSVKETVTYKLTYVVPIVKGFTFELTKNKKHRKIISKLIALRNDVVHLKPELETNTGYKGLYRELLDFDYTKALIAVKTFVNFYEPGLIEECECGKNIYFYSGEIDQKIKN